MASGQQAVSTSRENGSHTMWREKTKNAQDFEVKCNGVSIKPVSAVKYLGINIDSNMSGETTWKTIISKCNSRLKLMYRQAGCLPTATKKTLCLALTQCNFDYAVSSWYSSLSQAAKKKLQVVQNKIIRFILNLGPRRNRTTKHTWFVKCGGQG